MYPAVPTGSTQNLRGRRIAAAHATLGLSADPIYAAAEGILRDLHPSGPAVDIGAGQGLFTRRLRRLDGITEVTAVDLVDYGVNWAAAGTRWVGSDLNERLDLPDASFGLVVALDVIEHLENPRFAVREWYRIVRPGGRILITTPNNESWRSLLSLVVRGHFADFQDRNYPAHVTALVRRDLIRILTEAGFTGVAFRSGGYGCVPGSWKVTWQRLSFGRLHGIRWCDNLLCTALRPSRP